MVGRAGIVSIALLIGLSILAWAFLLIMPSSFFAFVEGMPARLLLLAVLQAVVLLIVISVYRLIYVPTPERLFTSVCQTFMVFAGLVVGQPMAAWSIALLSPDWRMEAVLTPGTALGIFLIGTFGVLVSATLRWQAAPK